MEIFLLVRNNSKMEKKSLRIRRFFEEIEVLLEDIVIAIFAVLAIIVLFASIGALANAESLANAIASGQYNSIVAFMITGYAILPWMLILGIMLIARDLWIIRRFIERGVKFEAVLAKEIEELEEKEE